MPTRTMRPSLAVPLAAVLALLAVQAMVPADADDVRRPYRIRITASGFGRVTLRGRLVVDGVERRFEALRTPWVFASEWSQVVSGEFEVVTPGRTVRVRIYDPGLPRRRAAAEGNSARWFTFAWAQSGGGPRCLSIDPPPSDRICPPPPSEGSPERQPRPARDPENRGRHPGTAAPAGRVR